jgi:hypothetical protein
MKGIKTKMTSHAFQHHTGDGVLYTHKSISSQQCGGLVIGCSLYLNEPFCITVWFQFTHSVPALLGCLPKCSDQGF